MTFTIQVCELQIKTFCLHLSKKFPNWLYLKGAWGFTILFVRDVRAGFSHSRIRDPRIVEYLQSDLRSKMVFEKRSDMAVFNTPVALVLNLLSFKVD